MTPDQIDLPLRRHLTTPDGKWRIAAAVAEFFRIESVTVSRDAYRGNKIPSPWPTTNPACPGRLNKWTPGALACAQVLTQISPKLERRSRAPLGPSKTKPRSPGSANRSRCQRISGTSSAEKATVRRPPRDFGVSTRSLPVSTCAVVSTIRPGARWTRCSLGADTATAARPAR
jgi:hypothetical protein